MKFTHQEATVANVVSMPNANYAAMRSAASPEETFVNFGGDGVWIMQLQHLDIDGKQVPYVRLESTELTTVSNEDGTPKAVISYFVECYNTYMKYGYTVLYWSGANNRYEGPEGNPTTGFRNLVKGGSADQPRRFPVSDFDTKRLCHVLSALKTTAEQNLLNRPSEAKEIGGEIVNYTPVEITLLEQGAALGYAYYAPASVVFSGEMYGKHISVSLKFIEQITDDLFGNAPMETTVLPQLAQLGGEPVENGSFAFQCIRRFKGNGTEIRTLSLNPGAQKTPTSPKLSAMLTSTNAMMRKEVREILLQIFAQAIGLQWEIPAEYIHGAALKFGQVGQAEMPVNPDQQALAESLRNFQPKPMANLLPEDI